jgi:proteic killer suppression protein
MIRSFGTTETESLFMGRRVVRFQSFERTALRRLRFLNRIRSLADLTSPGFRLEKLRGDRDGQWSIRINDRWRICFHWMKGHTYDVEIVDYHA